MKSDMKKNLSRLVALGLVWVLGACVKDDPTGPGGPGRFRVSIQNLKWWRRAAPPVAES